VIQIFGPITESRRVEVIQDLDQASAIGRDYILLVLLSCVIATFGLVLNSGPVIIGAMLIAPLMSPILAFALALIRGDLDRLWRAVVTLLVGALLAVALSAMLGLLASAGAFNFLEELPAEILGRTRPTLFDLAIALAGGAAAAYALAQPHLSATLPGVAIATALMPPVCVVGIGLSQGRTDVAGGALLLFLANFVAIVFASSVIFAGIGFGPLAFARRRVVVSRALLFSSTLLLLVTAPLGAFMVRIVGDAHENVVIHTTLVNELFLVGNNNSLVSFERRWQGDHLDIVATIRAPRSLTFAEASRIQREVAINLQKPVALKLLVVPITMLDPLVPPTRTPTPLPGATAVPTSSPTPSPSITPSPTPSVTPSTTASPSPTPTVTASPTVTPVVYAVIGGTGRRGANLRRAPGLAAVVAALPDGTVVQLVGGRADADAFTWIEVAGPDGRVGWVAEDYLIPYHTYVAP
jgi:uncharacterized hydrophobic protein (TIGR00271 family)